MCVYKWNILFPIPDCKRKKMPSTCVLLYKNSALLFNGVIMLTGF